MLNFIHGFIRKNPYDLQNLCPYFWLQVVAITFAIPAVIIRLLRSIGSWLAQQISYVKISETSKLDKALVKISNVINIETVGKILAYIYAGFRVSIFVIAIVAIIVIEGWKVFLLCLIGVALLVIFIMGLISVLGWISWSSVFNFISDVWGMFTNTFCPRIDWK